MRRAHVFLVIAAAAALLAVVGPRPKAEAATARNLTLLYIDEDRFRNYDFTDRAVTPYGVDWPIALVFGNNATIDRVKARLGNEYDQTGGPMYGRMTDNAGSGGVGGGYVWDDDSGGKTTKCPGAPFQPDSARHYRIYADGDDRLYNLAWGYYVFGSTHWDRWECGGDTAWFGWSENAEGWLAWRWSTNGYSAAEDWASFYNWEPYRVEGTHVWENDGYATWFWVF
jgi:hypothetical protein